jgi:hypothetical protein
VDRQPGGAYGSDRNNWQPSAGLAYKVLEGKPPVFRAGRYFLPTTEFGGEVRILLTPRPARPISCHCTLFPIRFRLE